ncbi:MAG: carboxypeptidase-like regulatory domain-containing protein [Muribaculaceae bacterium]|nr:carboxypeptidase-like regulatory domain-containing protein [Muribaculaceae bacterium]
MRRRLSIVVSFILFIAIFSIGAQTPLIEVTGKVKNSKTKKALANAEVSIPYTNVGTVTNADGYFSLKFPVDKLSHGIKVDLIGYEGLTLPIPSDKSHQKNLTVFLKQSGKVLDEVLVLGGDPREIVIKAIEKIPDNYSSNTDLFQGFYRETVQKGNRYISVSEAMVDLLKRPYSRRDVRGEKVSIYKGRRLISPNNSDTLAIKLMDGPLLPINFDAVKNGDHLFSKDEIDYFEFTMLPPTIIDQRTHYSIGFKPRVNLSYPLHKGVFYIDTESLTISRVEFELDVKDKVKATRAILQKKPGGLNFRPLEVSGVVTYKTLEGKSQINYIATKIRFKCDWKKRLFSSAYTSLAEMVIVDRKDTPKEKTKFVETFGKRKIFSDMVENYWEPDFWKDYNIIEPSESLENAVKKLKKR